jgi:hypothetical protein
MKQWGCIRAIRVPNLADVEQQLPHKALGITTSCTCQAK